MEKETIQISKESMDTFNHDKNVVDMTYFLFSADDCRYPTRKEFAWYRHNKGV